MGELGGGTTGGDRPKPSVAAPSGGQPTFGADAAMSPAQPAAQSAPAPGPLPRREEPIAVTAPPPQPKAKKGAASATPGFDL